MAEAVAILKSSDLTRTLAWYADIGFSLRDRVEADGRDWAEVERDGLVLQFLAGETPWAESPGLTGCFYVRPESVDAVYEQIRGRVDCPWGVEERPWGARELTLIDPDGYGITFTQP